MNEYAESRSNMRAIIGYEDQELIDEMVKKHDDRKAKTYERLAAIEETMVTTEGRAAYEAIEVALEAYFEKEAEVIEGQKVNVIYNDEAYVIEGVPDTVDNLADAKGLKYMHPHDVDTIGYGLIHELWDKYCDCDYNKLNALLGSLGIHSPRIISNFQCYNPSAHTKKNTVETLTLTNKCNKGSLPKYTILGASKAENLVRLTDGKQVSYNDVIDAVLENRVYITNFSALNL
jgi:hypothetical protein